MKMKKFTAAERKAIRAHEARLLKNIDSMPPERRIIAEICARGRRAQDAKIAKVPEIGLFFLVGKEVFVDGTPLTEVPSIAGFRTYDVDHSKYWRQLQQIGAVPRNVPYDSVARGRVTYSDRARKFTLFADKCIIKSKKYVNQVMDKFGLPLNNTTVLEDDHYRCPNCLRKRTTRKQEEEDWDI